LNACQRLKRGRLRLPVKQGTYFRTIPKVAVFLVTPDFLASDIIRDNKLSPLLADAENSLVTILWVPVRASLVEETSLSKYQAASNPAKPLATMKAERDQAWVEISKAIRDALNP